MIAWQLLLCALLVGTTTARAQYFDTLQLHYAIGASWPDAAGQQALDSVARHLGSRKLLIYSYADYLGSERQNQHLSDARAEKVKQYLLKAGMAPGQIMECTGLGQIPGQGGSSGDPESRRTDVFIRRDAAGAKKLPQPVMQQKQPAGRRTIPDSSRITPIIIDSLKVNETLRLNNIEFYPGSEQVLPSGYSELENLYNVLYDNPRLKIRLEGHVCCCVYPDGFFENTPTWGLSVARARVVYQHLVNRGIDAGRMEYKGFGRTRPIRDHERTVEEGQVNRRVEVRILEK